MSDAGDRGGESTLWNKGVDAEDWVTRFTVGEDFRWDTLLLPFDIRATRVHAWGLQRASVLSEADLEMIEESLDQLMDSVRSGQVVVRLEDEDCHTVIERHLTAEAGDAGKKIHAGRSRNDQVLSALRLFLRDRLQAIGRRCAELAATLVTLGERWEDVVIPGYTHLQRAMPSTAGLWALGYAELLCHDMEMLGEAHSAIGVSPSGSAAGYGVPYVELPREEMARRLGFDGIQVHATAVQLSRGKLELQVVHALVQIASTVNRLASDLVLYNSAEFGFVRLPEAYCTGSSIMPQKRNPDVLELARATYHRVLAEMNVLATLPANLPSGYHRDLQLTKEAVMRAVLLSGDLLEAAMSGLGGVEFDAEKARSALSSDLFATAAAMKLVREGVPFRDAYRGVASDPDSWRSASGDPIKTMYPGLGGPGRLASSEVRSRIESSGRWMRSSKAGGGTYPTQRPLAQSDTRSND